jgi:hypothetical protein
MTKNTVKEKITEEVKPKQTKSSGGNIVTRTIGSVMSGSFLSRDSAINALPFMFFMTLVVLFYIANGYYAEGQIRRQNDLARELKQLRSEYITSKSALTIVSERQAVKVRALPLGLKESEIDPPFLIAVKELPE